MKMLLTLALTTLFFSVCIMDTENPNVIKEKPKKRKECLHLKRPQMSIKEEVKHLYSKYNKCNGRFSLDCEKYNIPYLQGKGELYGEETNFIVFASGNVCRVSYKSIATTLPSMQIAFSKDMPEKWILDRSSTGIKSFKKYRYKNLKTVIILEDKLENVQAPLQTVKDVMVKLRTQLSVDEKSIKIMNI